MTDLPSGQEAVWLWNEVRWYQLDSSVEALPASVLFVPSVCHVSCPHVSMTMSSPEHAGRVWSPLTHLRKIILCFQWYCLVFCPVFCFVEGSLDAVLHGLPNEVAFIIVMEMTGGNGVFRDCKLILVLLWALNQFYLLPLVSDHSFSSYWWQA